LKFRWRGFCVGGDLGGFPVRPADFQFPDRRAGGAEINDRLGLGKITVAGRHLRGVNRAVGVMRDARAEIAHERQPIQRHHLIQRSALGLFHERAVRVVFQRAHRREIRVIRAAAPGVDEVAESFRVFADFEKDLKYDIQLDSNSNQIFELEPFYKGRYIVRATFDVDSTGYFFEKDIIF